MNKVFRTFTWASPDDAKKIAPVISKFEEYWFLGMVNYLAKFLPRLSEETEVLRKLTEKDAEWCWMQSHADAVARVKGEILQSVISD